MLQKQSDKIEPIGLNSVFDVPNVEHFFFDMYGVLWNGKALYEGVADKLIALRAQGKKVYIFSNQTVTREKFIAVRNNQGLVFGTHYDDVITSGAVCFDAFEKGLLESLTGKSAYKLLVLGGENSELCCSVQPYLTTSVEEADILYISSIIDNSIETMKTDFIPVMRRAIERGVPAVCANPDVHVMIENQKMFAQGVAGKWYAEHGGKVVWFGKPCVATYQYALSYAGADVEKSVMVGDMLVTDILGANRAHMRSILVTQTGMTGYELMHQKISLKEFIDNMALSENHIVADLTPTYTLPQVGVLLKD